MPSWNFIVDADDTLWSTELLYDEAREACADYLIADVDPAAWLAKQSEVDSGLFRELGLSPRRFPASCVIASRSLVPGLSDADERALHWLAEAVFRRRAQLVDGVHDALSELRGLGDLTLLTQGDGGVQAKRIDQSGLARYFKRISVTSRKTAADFASLRDDCSSRWISIGNSLRADIEPAVHVGMFGIWLRDVPMWDRERVAGTPDFAMEGCRIAADLQGAVEVVRGFG